MRLRRLAIVLLTCISVLVLAAIAHADYTTDEGNTVQWLHGDTIVVRDDSGRVLYQGPGTEDKNGRLVPPHSIEVGSTPPNPQNTKNHHTQTASEGYTVWDGDVPIKNTSGKVIGWGTIYTDPKTGLGKVIINDPVTGAASGDWVRNEHGYDNVVWVPTGNNYGGWVCVGCELPQITWGGGGGRNGPGSYNPPPPPPPPPVNIGPIVPSTGNVAKRGQAVVLQISTSGPAGRVEVELPAAFKNVPVQWGDGRTEIVANTHTAASATGSDKWTYRFVLAWTQSRPADGRYRITVRAYGDEGQTSVQELELTVQGMVEIYNPGG